MTQHIHHDLIVQWAKDTTQVVECFREDIREWQVLHRNPQWIENKKYRIRHKHQDLIDQKAARPELIVEVDVGDKWLSVRYPNWDETCEYRLVEPTKKKVKMWQWVMRSARDVIFITAGFHKNEASACTSCNTSKPIQCALWTEIEVDE